MKKIDINLILESTEGQDLVSSISNELWGSFGRGRNEKKKKLLKKGKKVFLEMLSKILMADNESEIDNIITKYRIKTIFNKSFIIDLYGSYLGKSGALRSSFIKLLKNNGLNICPFCNYTSINDQQLTYDHILDKSTNYKVAFSLKNLLPTCYSCNMKKSTNVYYNFYLDNISNDFDFFINFENLKRFRQNGNNFNITCIYNNSDISLNNYLDKFIYPLYCNNNGGISSEIKNIINGVINKNFYESFSKVENFTIEDSLSQGTVKLNDLKLIHKLSMSKFKLSAIESKNYNIDLIKNKC